MEAVGEAAGDQVEVGAAQPSTSSAAAETLATASASGTSAGIASRARSVETSSGGITTIPSRPSGGSKRAAVGAPSPPAPQTTKPP